MLGELQELHQQRTSLEIRLRHLPTAYGTRFQSGVGLYSLQVCLNYSRREHSLLYVSQQMSVGKMHWPLHAKSIHTLW